MQRAKSVYLVEDNIGHAEIVQRAFEESHLEFPVAITHFNCLANLRARIEDSQPDILLMDMKLPDGVGLDFITGNAYQLRFPCVLLTSFGNEKYAVDSMKSGLQDYIIKSDVTLSQIPKVVNQVLREWQYRKNSERDNRIFHAVAKGLSNRDGTDFHSNLVRSIRSGLDADLVFIGTFASGNTDTLRLLAATAELPVAGDAGVGADATVGAAGLLCIAGSPHAEVLRAGSCFVPEELGNRVAPELAEAYAGYDAYIGALIRGQDDVPLGIICSLHAGGDESLRIGSSVLEIYANITAQQLENQRKSEERNRLLQQLRQAQKMEALGRLTGGIAHDFNNLLSSVLGYSELALEQFPTLPRDKLLTYVRQIHKAGIRAQDLVAQMLMFSRKGQANLQTLLLADLVQETLDLLRPVLPSSISITAQLEPDVPPVLFDPGYFNQALINLCLNARDAMHGRGCLDVRLHADDVDAVCSSCNAAFAGRFAVVDVRDDGDGIAEDQLSSIFDPFHTTKEVGQGTGMGLAMVHGVLHDAGGHVLVRSEPGKGSCFSLLLPLDAAAAEAAGTVAGAYRPAAFSCSGKHALVVDDEAMNVSLFTDILQGMGFTVSAFTNSVEALAALQQQHASIDLLITDQTMPELTGLQLSAEARALQPALPIILCTGYSRDISSEQLELLQSMRLLMKPVLPSALKGLIEELLHAAPDTPVPARVQDSG